ncbi:MAG: ATP-binding protein [Halodesulfurarchaeum sp.]|nr:ATP-binding protein [Halodesulfurarchaeum sp.]
MSTEQVLLVTAGSQMENLVATALDSHTQLTVVPATETLGKLRDRAVDSLIVTEELAATDSLDLVREIRREFPTLPISFISESDSGVLASEALAAGVDDYVPLSVVSTNPDRLRSGLDRAMQVRSLSDPLDELAALHTATREMIAAASADALANRVVEASSDVLGFEYASVYWVDDERRTLRPVAWTEQLEATIEEPPALGPDSLAWPAFINTSTKYYADVSTVEETPTMGTAVRTEMYVPLGDYGLLSVSSPEQDAFNAHQREIISILGANATAAHDSITKTTELRETAQALTSRNEQLDQFVSVVSHDLRNPLNVAAGRLELAREECTSEHLVAVADAHNRMNTLIENLLILARSEGQVDEMEPVDLKSVVAGCWQHVDTDEATLVTDIDRRVQANRSRLEQLLENLLRNAVEHGGSDVTITIGALEDGFYVEDDGPGIPEAAREEVFEMGYSTTENGTGFGLSIVEQVAKAHGWDIHLADGSAGGARFEITGVETAT